LQSLDWQVIQVTDELPEDTQFASLERKYGSLLKELARRVGHTNVELDARGAVGRTRETNIGDFVADAFRRATGADVAIMNGGSIRADDIIKPGDLTRRDVLSLLPFKNRVVKMELTGATLRAALEHGVARSAEDAEPGRFPQVPECVTSSTPAAALVRALRNSLSTGSRSTIARCTRWPPLTTLPAAAMATPCSRTRGF